MTSETKELAVSRFKRCFGQFSIETQEKMLKTILAIIEKGNNITAEEKLR